MKGDETKLEDYKIITYDFTFEDDKIEDEVNVDAILMIYSSFKYFESYLELSFYINILD